MADSIKELILKDIKTVLEGIKTESGYNNTVKSVQRFQIAGQTTVDIPYIIVIQGDVDVLAQGPNPQATKRLEVHLDVVTRQDPDTDSRNSDEIMNSLEADIEKALQIDPGRDSNATDTSPLEVVPLTVEEGQSNIESIMTFKVDYRHQRTDQTAI